LAALRFLLGVLESPLIPGQVVTTARFYTQQEVPLRIAYWTLANTLLPIPFSVIYFAVGNTSPHPLQPWRWIFVIVGLCTIVVAGLILLVIPDSPSSAWWLTQRQRVIVVERVARTQVGIKSHKFKKEQFFEALLDVRAWL
jgi:MFS family permease